MAEPDIIRSMITREGVSRNRRMAPELGVHYADVDERKPEEMLLLAQRFAELVAFPQAGAPGGSEDWTDFFAFEGIEEARRLVASQSGEVTPHLSLFLAFIELYQKPREILNTFTGSHLDFYFRQVLGFADKPPRPDRAHLVIELKKKVPPLAIGPEHGFSAGKDATGKELVYVPTTDTVITAACVQSLRSVFRDPGALGTVRYAPIANSSNGVGGELDTRDPSWSAFGHRNLDPAQLGFALSAPILRLREGVRKITVTLKVTGIDPALARMKLNGLFNVYLTGPETEWLGPFPVSPLIEGDRLTFVVTLEAKEKAVVDCGAGGHGFSYAATAPVMQVLLNPEFPGVGYASWRDVRLITAALSVEVSGVTSLAVESEAGPIDVKKPFLPFGPLPVAGSRFSIGCPEMMEKELTRVELTLNWKDVPNADLGEHYEGYRKVSHKAGRTKHGSAPAKAPLEPVEFSNRYFTASVSLRDGAGKHHPRKQLALFDASDAAAPVTLPILEDKTVRQRDPFSEGKLIRALYSGGMVWSKRMAHAKVLGRPVLESFQRELPESSAGNAPEAKPGLITFTLDHDFLHAAYRKKHLETIVTYTTAPNPKGELVLPNEPYTPAIRSLSLNYRAHSGEVQVSSPEIKEFADDRIRFFHICYSGQLREHAFQRAQFGFLEDKTVSLFPRFDHEGEFLIGLAELLPNDSVSILFEVAQGSDVPGLERQGISWFVLCDNYWRPLAGHEVLLDSTNGFLSSGIIRFLIPPEATTVNTVLPSGCIWLKGAVLKETATLCRLLQVAPNALEVEFRDSENDPSHLAAPLPAGSIKSLKTPIGGIKSIQQPFASFGGAGKEAPELFSTRVAERLRHKNRCLTAWDYERIVLEAFPEVHKVKCIPHAKRGTWLAPGNVLLVLVPDLRRRPSQAMLQPKLDSGTLKRIVDLAQSRAGMQVTVDAKNPAFQRVRLDFRVAFRGGDFNYQKDILKRELTQFLSPWAFDADRELSFGGRIYKSVLMDFVEELEYVDYVTDFKMYSYLGETCSYLDLDAAEPETPDAILVSDDDHTILEVKQP